MGHLGSPWRHLLSTAPPPIAEANLADAAASAAPVLPPPSAACVPRIKACELSYERFCLEFLEPNLPLLIEGATKGWAASRDWVTADGGVDLNFLEQRFGTAQVLVTDTARRHEGSGPCQRMRLADFLAWWRQHRQQEEEQQQPAPGAAAVEGEEPQWYCKDWHLASEFPEYQAYTCPCFFQDDWLNEWFDARQQGLQQAKQAGCGGQQPQTEPSGGVQASDYRFVYLGPAGTSTPLHADVLRSYSWSANIAGRKRWRLLPPQYTHLVINRHGRDVVWDFFADDAGGEFPGLEEARRHLVVLDQQPGEALFVPSGWFHTVENLDDCVSINHNWFNGHNVSWVWALLRRERQQAEGAIDDCRELCSPPEFEGLVQRNLGANAGLDWAGLGALLRCIAAHSLALLTVSSTEGQSAAVEQRAAAGHQPEAAAAEAIGRGSEAQEDPAWGDQAYHTFRVQRAGLVLTQLLSEQRCIDSCECAAESKQSYHAFEVAANAACLEQITQRMRGLGLDML